MRLINDKSEVWEIKVENEYTLTLVRRLFWRTVWEKIKWVFSRSNEYRFLKGGRDDF